MEGHRSKGTDLFSMQFCDVIQWDAGHVEWMTKCFQQEKILLKF